jgi:hypothetical protein
MSNLIFVLFLAVGLSTLLYWAFKTLPHERWQIMATIPWRKTDNGRWIGLNFTYYGFFTASAQTFALTVFFILMGTLQIPLIGIFYLTFSLLSICLPASWLIAALIEKKKFTFTVGGASLLGLVAAPVSVLIFNRFFSSAVGFEIPGLAAMAAVSTAYLFGEGLGRLACISFGCCYGKPLSEAPEFVQKVFGKNFFLFTGKTKKIAYESGLEGVAVVPIQAVTSILLLSCGLLTTFLFLEGQFRLAFAIAICFAHGWRIVSETLRADFRGGGKFSSYQKMSVLAICFALFLVFILPLNPALKPSLLLGIQQLWQPLVLVILQIQWVILFLAVGSSMVTGSVLDFSVRNDRI